MTQKARLFGAGIVLLVVVLALSQVVQWMDKKNAFSSPENSVLTGRFFEPVQAIANPTPGNNKTPLDRVHAFNEQARQLLAEPGWIHYSEHRVYDSDTPNNGVSEEGVAIPKRYYSDTWFHINEQGLVFESVTIQRDEEGKIFQEGFYQNGITTNLQFKWQQEMAPFPLIPDFGLAQELSRTDFSQVTVAELVQNGRTYQQIRIRRPEEVAQVSDYQEKIKGSIVESLIDTQSGLTVTHRVQTLFEDGSVRDFETITVEIQHHSEPDPVVYEYLIH